jgi:hypothetical protein
VEEKATSESLSSMGYDFGVQRFGWHLKFTDTL